MKAMSNASGATAGYVTTQKDANTGVMVALRIPAAIGQQLLAAASKAGVPAECLQALDGLHVTLCYLGDTQSEPLCDTDEENLQGELEHFALGWGVLKGELNGVGRFMDNPKQDCLYVNFDCPDLPRFRQALLYHLSGANITAQNDHGYTPHCTLAYIPKSLSTPTIAFDPIPVAFTSLWEAHGDCNYDIPLSLKGVGELPYKIVKDKSDKKYRVLNQTSGERTPKEGHATQSEARDYLRALYANVPDAGKASLDGDDDSALIQVGCHVYWHDILPEGNDSDEEHICWGTVKDIQNGMATVEGPDGSMSMHPVKDLEPDTEDDHPLEAEKASHRRNSNYDSYFYGDAPGSAPSGTANVSAVSATSGKVADEEVSDEAAKGDDEGQHFAYPEEKKLPMPDADHVIKAAAALGPNPPHGNEADIPKDKLGEVKGRIRARAKALGMGKDQIAKVNAYLSGHMPSAKMSDATVNAWSDIFEKALSQTNSMEMAACAAQGALNRRVLLSRKDASSDLPTTVEGWAVLFSDESAPDLQGTYFDDMTRLFTQYYQSAPLWMEHGHDRDYGADPIGQRYLTQVFPIGVWLGHRLDTNHPLYARTARDAADGAFTYSSDSILQYVYEGFDPMDGRLGEWPLAGCSLTRNPAEPGLGPVNAKSYVMALKSIAQQREVAGETPQSQKASDSEQNPKIGEKPTMDPETEKDILPEEEDDNFDEPDGGDNSSTMDALARMYGTEPEPEKVRAKMDEHIAQLKAGNPPHPDLLKAMDLPEGSDAKAVEDHLNNLYSAAMSVPEPAAQPAEPVAPRHNYNVLHNHLHSGGAAAKSRGPFMTGALAQKGVNIATGISKTPLMAYYADLMRMSRFERPKHIIGVGAAKAMTSATGPTGGYILHQEIAPNVLDPLRPKVVAYQLGATRLDMEGTNVLTSPVMNSAPDANWVGENQAQTDTQPGYRTVTLYPHGLSVLVKVPFNVEANMTPQAEKQLRDQMAKSVALKIDKAVMLGTGGALVANGGVEIVGILNTPGAQTYMISPNGRVPSFIDVDQAFGLLDDANVPYDESSRRGLAMHSKISRAFKNATDSLGNPLLRPSWAAAPEGDIVAVPYGISNQIPTNVVQGNANNSSYIFAGDWQYIYIGISNQVEVRLDQTFAGNLQAGLLVYVYADVKIVYPQAFVTMIGALPPTISGVTTGSNAVN